MRIILRLLLVVLLVGVGVVVFQYATGSSWPAADSRTGAAVGTAGTSVTIDKEKARERGAEIGEKAAVATEKIRDTAHDAAITTKIKAKMALDDSVKARAIDVSTDGATVTLSGTVGSSREHDRAVTLARETDGVSHVIDRLAIRGR